jgi:hypothetical protein
MPLLLLLFLLDTPTSFTVRTITTEGAIDLATQTLTRSLDIDADDAKVVSALPVKWQDGSLGCPQAGISYPEEVIPGYRVVFRWGTLSYRVHVGNGRAVVCRDRKSQANRTNLTGLVTALGLAELAREDLVARLGVDSADIQVKVLKQMTWPDTSLGCPVEGNEPEAVEIPGYLIELVIEDQTYVYHSDLEAPFLCKTSER